MAPTPIPCVRRMTAVGSGAMAPLRVQWATFTFSRACCQVRIPDHGVLGPRMAHATPVDFDTEASRDLFRDAKNLKLWSMDRHAELPSAEYVFQSQVSSLRNC